MLPFSRCVAALLKLYIMKKATHYYPYQVFTAVLLDDDDDVVVIGHGSLTAFQTIPLPAIFSLS